MAGYPYFDQLQTAPGQMATLGSPQAATMQTAPAVSNLGSIAAQQADAQRRLLLAEALRGVGYVPNSGAMGALAQIVSAWKGKKIARKAGESIADALTREFEEKRKIAEQQAAAAAQAEAAKAERNHKYRLQERDQPPASAREFEMARNDPAYREFLDRRLPQRQPVRPPESTNQEAVLASRKAALESQILPSLRQQLGARLTQPMEDAVVSQYLGTGRFDLREPQKPAASAAASAAGTARTNTVEAATKAAELALDFAARSTGIPKDTLRQLSPDELEQTIKEKGNSRWLDGPAVAEIPLVGSLLQRVTQGDLLSTSEAAAAKIARANNPTGPVTNADVDLARLSTFRPGASAESNAAAIRRAIEDRNLATSKPTAADADARIGPLGGSAAAPPGQIAINPKTGERLQLVNGQWEPVR